MTVTDTQIMATADKDGVKPYRSENGDILLECTVCGRTETFETTLESLKRDWSGIIPLPSSTDGTYKHYGRCNKHNY